MRARPRPGRRPGPTAGPPKLETAMARLGFVEPMKASTGAAPSLSDPGWVYEVKFDGYRGLAVKNGREVALFSRTRNRLDARFPGVVRAVAALPARACVLDGEV